MAEASNPDPEYRTKFHFRLWHLFYLMAFYASGLAIVPMSWVVTTGWLTACAIALSYGARQGCNFLIWVVLIVLTISGLVTTSGFEGLRPSSPRRISCKNNMRHIMVAMLNYESIHGQLPPARVLDAAGKPMNSWRVLLLPHLGDINLHNKYDFGEPWDGPNNRLLVNAMPAVYRCPSSTHAGMTQYKLVTGPGTAFPDGMRIGLNNIRENAANCAALVEDAEPVNWMEPSDLTLEEAIEIFSREVGSHPIHVWDGLFSKRSVGTNVGLLDGSVAGLDPINNRKELEKLFGIDKGDFDLERLGLGGRTHYKYGAMIAAVIYVLLAWIPVHLLVTKGPGSLCIRSFRLDSPDHSDA